MEETNVVVIDLLEAVKKARSERDKAYTVDESQLPNAEPGPEKEGVWSLEVEHHEGRLVKTSHSGLHPLVDCADKAFCGHFHIKLCADDFLYPLLTQLAILKNFAEAGKDTVKLRLTVARPDFALGNKTNPWEEIFAEFHTQIAGHVGAEEAGLFDPKFSTTSWLKQCGYDVALMDAYQSMFDYHNMFMCGIPSIRLVGTPEDWKTFETHASRVVGKMVELGAAKDWEKGVLQIIRNIAASGQGKLERQHLERFWLNFYRWETHSGGAGIDGWICSFFPIISRRDGTCVVGQSTDDIYGRNTFGRTRDVCSFPAGIASAPVTCDNNGVDFNLSYNAGMVGVSQDDKGVLYPSWGYRIMSALASESEPKVTVMKQFVEADIKTPWGESLRSIDASGSGKDLMDLLCNDSYFKERAKGGNFRFEYDGGAVIDLEENILTLKKQFPNQWKLVKLS